jgi:CDP-paratose 2-epimerase
VSAFNDAENKRDLILVTGGAGFIGTNMAERLLHDGLKVRLLDSLVRPGSDANVRWIRERYPDQVEFIQGDVRDMAAVRHAVRDVSHIYHFAAQVAVTTSLTDPLADFEINARGTLNVLEAARACQVPPSILFTSTNKVYGALADVKLQATEKRYVPADPWLRGAGVGESRSLEFHSPYGCSKGAAEQYVLDYARSYGLRTVVMRMSCIYGPHQNGTEDQGWVAHFMRAALAGRAITIFGTGLQVRDLLFVEDLLEAFECARRDIQMLSGRAFNIGGGVENAASVLEVIEKIEHLTHLRCRKTTQPWRLGDQRYYVSDITSFEDTTRWHPRTRIDEGLAALLEWYEESSSMQLDHPAMASVAAAGIEARP